jgi:DNA-binding NarL/FixJ family response regulator
MTEPRPFQTALIVEDHPLFSEALAMTLRAFVGIERIMTADRLALALQRLSEAPSPDVVLLDLHLPDVTGMDGLIRLRQAAPRVPVVVVSSLADARVIGAALAAGAAGFVPKHSQREVFRAAFAAIGDGRSYTPDGYQPGAGAEGPGENEAVARLRTLTRQQAAILQLICAGKPNKVIAWELTVAETTVKAHVTAIMRKLGVTSRTQAVLMATGVNFAALMAEGGAG